MTRDEHLKWCKERALQYLEKGKYYSLTNAVKSMTMDLGKHDETKDHPGLQVMVMLMIGNQLSDEIEVRKFIEGFN